MTIFVDTNVLVYAKDRSAPSKQIRADGWLRRLWAERSGVLSPQILREYYVAASRRGADQERVRADVRALQTWLTPETAVEPLEDAWTLQDRYGFSFFDSLMLASALAAGCRYVLTEDLQHGQKVASLTVLDPFVVEPLTNLL